MDLAVMAGGAAAVVGAAVSGRLARVRRALGRGRVVAWAALAAGLSSGCQLQTTVEDFEVPGTEVGEVSADAISPSAYCRGCHSDYDTENEPFATWSGSLMAHAGRDPLFLAQMTTANQDAREVGYYCLRCHVPMSWVTGNALPADGSALDATDLDGVNCHFCHAMVDPIFKPGESPPEDEAILAGLASKPEHYGNAMFVIDPSGTRRGPLPDARALHEWTYSPFHTRSEFCGTCHDVGSVATTRQRDGTWKYNGIGAPATDPDPAAQFPLERTYTEWRLSRFADGGVDLGGRFGGAGASVVSTCQDCHMPRAEAARACVTGPVRAGLRRHSFAGAAAPSLDLIAHLYADDPSVDLDAIARGRAEAVSMLERAATLELETREQDLVVRIVNETGHKLPTGHIEGRRVFLSVRFLDATGAVLREHGAYDGATATLAETTTAVYEMRVGISKAAGLAVGQFPGPTTHMALADTIVKDNRIPPRGFVNATFEEGGAPVVAWRYADGQHWDERAFRIPAGAVRAEAALFYQSTPREYIEHLRDANVTDHWGTTLYESWEATGRGAPIEMARAELEYPPNPCSELRPGESAPPADVLVSADASGRSTLRFRSVTIDLPEPLAIDPVSEAVALSVSDPAGIVWGASIAEGGFVAQEGGGFALAPGARGAAGLDDARLSTGPSGREVAVEARGTGQWRPIQPGEGSVAIRVGDVCFVGPAKFCEAAQSATACP